MKKIISLITVILGTQMTFASQFPPGTKIQCEGQPGTGFVLSIQAFNVPRVAPFDDAVIIFEQGQHNWNWLQLAAYNEGALISQYIFNIMGGGQLVVSESVKIGHGGCGRGSCDNIGISKVINAKLTATHGQQYTYVCKKIL